jgi:hypothetical protein
MKIVLHIGGSKCGSSAIQASLRQNAEALAAIGVIVPSQNLDGNSAVTGEQIWLFENAAANKEEQKKVAAFLRDAADRAADAGATTLIVSAENICNHPALAAPLVDALDGIETQVVFYVRRQDDFLISGWQQWHLKQFDSLASFLSDRVGRVANWYEMICPWADAFGDENIVVRPFVRDRLKDNDVVADFFEQIGVNATKLKPLERVANPSFDEALGRIAHRVRDVFDDQHDNRFYEVMVRLLGPAALKSASSSSLLDFETRTRILARYAEDNEALKNRFLPELGNQPLFHSLKRADVIETSEAEKLSEELAMLTRAVYALARRSEMGRAP